MNISSRGLDLIKEFEGFRGNAYYDAVGVITIGFGTTNADSSIIGQRIYPGMSISKETATAWLEKSVNYKYVPLVMQYDSTYHWNQHQLDALTSFAYNIGSIDQLTANGSRSIAEISEKILLYDKAGGQTLAGLTRRRRAEKALFDEKVGNVPIGWMQDNNGWWYRLKDGSYPKSTWMQIDNLWYYFNAEGYMASNEYIKSSDYDKNKKLYYVYKDGHWDGDTYQWKQDSVGWWLSQVGGKYYPKGEWCKIDGIWYRFDDRGYLVE